MHLLRKRPFGTTEKEKDEIYPLRQNLVKMGFSGLGSVPSIVVVPMETITWS
jgi:hypothetical protein